MGKFSAWSYLSDVTFWRPTLDEAGQPTSHVRFTHKCSYMTGGKQSVDDVGEQFSPRMTVWLESNETDAPKTGDLMAIGELTVNPPLVYEIVRTVRGFDPNTFSEGLTDYEVLT